MKPFDPAEPATTTHPEDDDPEQYAGDFTEDDDPADVDQAAELAAADDGDQGE